MVSNYLQTEESFLFSLLFNWVQRLVGPYNLELTLLILKKDRFFVMCKSKHFHIKDAAKIAMTKVL